MTTEHTFDDARIQRDEVAHKVRRARPRFGEMYFIGKIKVMYRDFPGCKVCNDLSWGARLYVEQGYVDGEPYRTIFETLPEHERVLTSYDSVRGHCKDHLPSFLKQERATLDARAEEAADRAHQEQVIDYLEIGRVAERRVYRKLRRGEIQPTIQDVIGLNKLKLMMGMTEQAEEDREVFKAVLAAQLRIASRFIPVEFRDAYINELRNDPMLQRFLADAAKEAPAIASSNGSGDAH